MCENLFVFSDAALFLISSKNSYSIGRKNCDITLDGDLSISKKHCNIYVAEKDKCPFFTDTSTGVWIVDEESKYGTYVRGDGEWEKLNAGQEKKLNHGSIIKFGLIQSIWR